MKKKIAILGSTGSIGKITLNIIKQNKNNFEIKLLSTNKNIKMLISQARIFSVKNLIVTSKKHYVILKKKNRNKNIKIYNNFLSFNKIFN